MVIFIKKYEITDKGPKLLTQIITDTNYWHKLLLTQIITDTNYWHKLLLTQIITENSRKG
jgi:hypothetical protein